MFLRALDFSFFPILLFACRTQMQTCPYRHGHANANVCETVPLHIKMTLKFEAVKLYTSLVI